MLGVKVGDRVMFMGYDNYVESGTVTKVTKDEFNVQWDDGGFSTEDKHEPSQVSYSPAIQMENTSIEDSIEKTLAEYIASIDKKYPKKDAVNQTNSNVDKPKHYQILPGYEVRDICKVMADKLQAKGYSGFFISDYVQMLQYVLRFQDKNGKEDLEKTSWYLNKMLEQLKEAK